MLTAACPITKRFTVGATYICLNSTGAVMRKCPLACSHRRARRGFGILYRGKDPLISR